MRNGKIKMKKVDRLNKYMTHTLTHIHTKTRFLNDIGRELFKIQNNIFSKQMYRYSFTLFLTIWLHQQTTNKGTKGKIIRW